MLRGAHIELPYPSVGATETVLMTASLAKGRTVLDGAATEPEVIELAAGNRAPQHLVHYLRDLANDFHTYYNAHVFIVGEDELRDARLTLCAATRQVIANGLAILGVSAPDSM